MIFLLLRRRPLGRIALLRCAMTFRRRVCLSPHRCHHDVDLVVRNALSTMFSIGRRRSIPACSAARRICSSTPRSPTCAAQGMAVFDELAQIADDRGRAAASSITSSIVAPSGKRRPLPPSTVSFATCSNGYPRRRRNDGRVAIEPFSLRRSSPRPPSTRGRNRGAALLRSPADRAEAVFNGRRTHRRDLAQCAVAEDHECRHVMRCGGVSRRQVRAPRTVDRCSSWSSASR